MNSTPPRLAEMALRHVLAARDRDTVSGDLLEKYREDIQPRRGPFAADVWYVWQVFGYFVRSQLVWALLFSGAFVARTAIDWLVPTTDFFRRSQVSTALAVGTLLLAGFCSAWKAGSLFTGVFAGIGIMTLGACVSWLGVAVLLLTFHDANTMEAIRGSGGLEEAFVLPIILILPGTVISTVGGIFGGTIRRVLLDGPGARQSS